MRMLSLHSFGVRHFVLRLCRSDNQAQLLNKHKRENHGKVFDDLRFTIRPLS